MDRAHENERRARDEAAELRGQLNALGRNNLGDKGASPLRRGMACANDSDASDQVNDKRAIAHSNKQPPEAHQSIPGYV